MRKIFLAIALATSLILSNCVKKSTDTTPIIETPEPKTYSYLPENLVARDDEKGITAQYVDTTLRYSHGILGDNI